MISLLESEFLKDFGTDQENDDFFLSESLKITISDVDDPKNKENY